MRRRHFLAAVLGGAAAMVYPARRAIRWMAPTPFVEALRARRYPGRVVAKNEPSVRKIGKWAG